ncbi:hypothetical protein BCR33DRAFT_714060 [Rhizoclosmatium globosum]|uniref:Uncharacterized protein n=1 Tax=Rhizoclosmatium globosum TaxID=329046 RepID=A0A1Y2CPM0_9FUNG|nr:hypothetical protein BCR33DRAFT_714060 [Rhizoclosmatium globosum]|eukprot:ORY48970.1 hypothetical protein BCR33DRAFT_714060 [Rhizoclosmatium globosum]
MGVVYLHIPSAPIPVLHSRTRLDFPFRLKSPVKTSDDEADYVVLFFKPGTSDALQVAWVANNPTLPSEPGSDESTESPQKRLHNPVVQLYEAPIASFLTPDALAAPPYLTPNSLPAVPLRYLGAEKIPGKLHVMSISKFTYPNPSLALLYFKIGGGGESYSFHTKVIEMFSNNEAASEIHRSDSGCFKDGIPCGCVNFLSSDKESCTHDGALKAFEFEMPGNMWINKFLYTYRKSLLYWRQLDDYMFRMIPTADSKIHGKIESESVNAGPMHDKPGYGSGFKSLALVEMFAEEGAQTVLDFRYKADGDDDFWFYIFINHRGVGQTNWTQTIVHKTFESLRQVNDLPIQFDDYYFINNPVVSTARNGTCAVFLWKGILHVFDYVGSKNLVSGAPHGLTLMKSRLVKSLQTNVRMRGAVVDDDGLLIAMVTDTDNVISLQRNFTVRPRPEPLPVDPVYETLAPDLAAQEAKERNVATQEQPQEQSQQQQQPKPLNPAEAFFRAPFEIGFLFDAQPSVSNIGSVANLQNPETPPPPKPVFTTTLVDTLERGPWRLDKLWSPDFLNEVSLKKASIVSIALVPPQSTPDSQPPAKLISLLWSNDVLTVLNLSASQKDSFVLRFMQEKWVMFMGMAFVVAMFVQYEIAWAARDAMLRAYFARPFPAAVVAGAVVSHQRALAATVAHEEAVRAASVAHDAMVQNAASRVADAQASFVAANGGNHAAPVDESGSAQRVAVAAHDTMMQEAASRIAEAQASVEQASVNQPPTMETSATHESIHRSAMQDAALRAAAAQARMAAAAQERIAAHQAAMQASLNVTAPSLSHANEPSTHATSTSTRVTVTVEGGIRRRTTTTTTVSENGEVSTSSTTVESSDFAE